MSRGRDAVIAVLLVLAGCSSENDASTAGTSSVAEPAPTTNPLTTLPAASPCTDEIAVSPRRSDGGHYRPGAPAKDTLLEPGVTGTRLVI
jgi:hypothetical protein